MVTYTLINKDAPLCDFVIEGEGELELCKIVKRYSPLSFWCENIDSWVAERSAAKHRAHPCDERFTEKRLSQMNMIKIVQCERILGFDAKWKF